MFPRVSVLRLLAVPLLLALGGCLSGPRELTYLDDADLAHYRDVATRIVDLDESDEERDALTSCLALLEAESAAARTVKAAQARLDARVLAKYPELSEAEIKALAVDDKWFASIQSAIEGEVQRLTQQLAGRVKELDERYARPLPVLEQDLRELSSKVEGGLQQMGHDWN